MKLIGQGNVYNDKSYSLSDSKSSTVPSALGFNDTWYGGMVKRLYLTKDGVYLCCDSKENIVNILVPDTIPDDSLEGVGSPAIVPNSTDNKSNKVDRKTLYELAEKLEIEGKYATMKTVDLIEAIKEKGGVIDGM